MKINLMILVVLMLCGEQIYSASNNVGSGSANAEEELKRSAIGEADIWRMIQ